MSAYRRETLHEVWRITERRDGAVYHAEYVEDRWIPIGTWSSTRPDDDPDLMWVNKPTSYKGERARSVKV